MTLVTWQGVTARNIPTQGVKSTYSLIFESASNGFLPKETPFIFIALTYRYLMERSQSLPDLGSRISKFRYLYFIDTGTDINRQKFQADRSFGVALTNIQTL